MVIVCRAFDVKDYIYINVRMILSFWTDRIAANSVDRDQTVRDSSLNRVYTVCSSVSIFRTSISMIKPLYSNFRIITAIFSCF